MSEKRDSAAVRARVHDAVHRSSKPPASDPPIVTWRCAVCSKRILRVYLTPRGWLLLTDDMRVSLDEWIERTGAPYTAEQFRMGEVVAMDARAIKGIERLLPLDVIEWPAAKFEAECKGCGPMWHDLEAVRASVQRFRDTRRRVNESIPRPTV